MTPTLNGRTHAESEERITQMQEDFDRFVAALHEAADEHDLCSAYDDTVSAVRLDALKLKPRARPVKLIITAKLSIDDADLSALTSIKADDAFSELLGTPVDTQHYDTE